MVVNHTRPARTRPVPRSPLSRHTAFGRLAAAWHDAWLQHRAMARWQRELRDLDPRILRDVGLSPTAAAELAAATRRGESARGKITFPPQCLPGLAKLNTHLEG